MFKIKDRDKNESYVSVTSPESFTPENLQSAERIYLRTGLFPGLTGTTRLEGPLPSPGTSTGVHDGHPSCDLGHVAHLYMENEDEERSSPRLFVLIGVSCPKIIVYQIQSTILVSEDLSVLKSLVNQIGTKIFIL